MKSALTHQKSIENLRQILYEILAAGSEPVQDFSEDIVASQSLDLSVAVKKKSTIIINQVQCVYSQQVREKISLALKITDSLQPLNIENQITDGQLVKIQDLHRCGLNLFEILKKIQTDLVKEAIATTDTKSYAGRLLGVKGSSFRAMANRLGIKTKMELR